MEGRALSRPNELNEFCNYCIIKRLMAPSLNPSRQGREDVLLQSAQGVRLERCKEITEHSALLIYYFVTEKAYGN